MTAPSYITAQDVVDAIGQSTYMAIFDDAGSGVRATVDASPAVQTMLATSLEMVASWLPDIYPDLPPETGAVGVPSDGDKIPRLLKFAQLQWARLLSYQRHPEYARLYGATSDGSMEKQVEALMRRIQSGTQRITKNDNPPDPLPANVGGSSQSDGARIALSAVDGTSNMGDW